MDLKFINIDDVIVLHRHAVARYGGLGGIRDMVLLQSAVARQISISNYDESSDIYDLAAALTFGIIQNHPFNDGNKRAGLLAGLLILERNGKMIGKLHIKKWYTVMIGLATHRISEQQFAGWLRKHFE
jgi:death-on-curing protein